MNSRLSIFLLLVLTPSLVLLNSCEQIEALTSDDEVEEPAEEPEEPEEDVAEEPDPDLPEWYDPVNPVYVDGDTVYVMTSAVAADSSGARSAAMRSMEEQTKAAWSLLLDERFSRDDHGETASASDQGGDRYISALLFDHDSEIGDLSPSETIWYYAEGETVRCYIRHKYMKDDMSGVLEDIPD